MKRQKAREAGQATVELCLGFPFVMLVLLGVVQIAVVARDQVLVVHAAREAVRTAAVDADDEAVRRAAADGSGLDPVRLTVDVGPRGEPGSRVRVVVGYRCPTVVPLIGPLLGDVLLAADATMRVE